MLKVTLGKQCYSLQVKNNPHDYPNDCAFIRELSVDVNRYGFKTLELEQALSHFDQH
jgi:hypothetical protein